MREQIGYPYRQPGQGQQIQQQLDYTVEEGEEYYITRPHTSARHYANGQPTQFTQGNTKYNVKYGAPPVKHTIPRRSSQHTTDDDQSQPQTRRGVHWLVFVGAACFIMILGWVPLSAIGSWWQTTLDDWHYGRPRTFQTDQNVGHYGYTSHFIAVNLNGKIEIIETEPLNPNAQESTHMYIAATLATDQNLQPVTLHFEDLTGNGKLDMLVFVGNSLQVPLYNNGTAFQSQPPK